jgi:hypothetical protein
MSSCNPTNVETANTLVTEYETEKSKLERESYAHFFQVVQTANNATYQAVKDIATHIGIEMEKRNPDKLMQNMLIDPETTIKNMELDVTIAQNVVNEFTDADRARIADLKRRINALQQKLSPFSKKQLNADKASVTLKLTNDRLASLKEEKGAVLIDALKHRKEEEAVASEQHTAFTTKTDDHIKAQDPLMVHFIKATDEKERIDYEHKKRTGPKYRTGRETVSDYQEKREPRSNDEFNDDKKRVYENYETTAAALAKKHCRK